MNLIVTDHYEGYLLDDIESLMQEDFPRFWRWFDGKTGVIHEGKRLVYRHDWERFLEGRPEHPETWD